MPNGDNLQDAVVRANSNWGVWMAGGVATSGLFFATMLGALFLCSVRRTAENSESVARDDWTETMTSLAR